MTRPAGRGQEVYNSSPVEPGRVGSGRVGSGRVGSGQEIFKYHGSGRVTLIPIRPAIGELIREKPCYISEWDGAASDYFSFFVGVRTPWMNKTLEEFRLGTTRGFFEPDASRRKPLLGVVPRSMYVMCPHAIIRRRGCTNESFYGATPPPPQILFP